MRNAALALLPLVAGCITHTAANAYPLYPDPETPRSNDEIGILNGPIAVVDGRDVSDHGRTFALAPGCHSFRLLAKDGNGKANGAYIITLPQQTVTFWVRPRHFYAIDIKLRPATGEIGSGSPLTMLDHLPDGTVRPPERCPSP
jgi:hypothetical protein